MKTLFTDNRIRCHQKGCKYDGKFIQQPKLSNKSFLLRKFIGDFDPKCPECGKTASAFAQIRLDYGKPI